MPNMIKMWPWRTAPKKYKKLSKSGGDEDWIVYVPGEYKEDVDLSRWLHTIDSDNKPQKVLLENGDYIYIGSHA